MGDLLLMSPNRRRILVKARDAGGNLLGGTVFIWSENDLPRGRVDPSEGHATLHPVADDSIVDIVAIYEGRQRSRKLALGQTLCEFEFDDVNKAGGTGSGSAPTGGGASGWKAPAGIAAIVTAIGGILIGYWQYGPKLIGDDKVTLVVYVKDVETSAAISNAIVTVESAALQSPVISDSEGKVAIASSKGQRVTLVARAKGHSDTGLTINASDQPVQLLMPIAKAAAVAPVPPKSGSGASRAAFNPTGTWEVVASGDIALKRIRSGSFDLTSRADGRIGLSAGFDLDGTPAQATGEISRQGDRLYVVFEGARGPDRWNGTGTWAVVDGRLQGFLTDIKGAELPLSLRKP